MSRGRCTRGGGVTRRAEACAENGPICRCTPSTRKAWSAGSLALLAPEGSWWPLDPDMLPMLYAPVAGGEVAKPVFTPTLPPPEQAASGRRAAADERIGAAFRALCAGNAAAVEAVLQRV